MSQLDSAPEVLDAVIALVASGPNVGGVRVGTAPGLQGVQVFDGPPLGEVEIGDALALGLTVADATSILAEERQGWGGRRTDQLRVTGLAQSSTGEVDVAPARRRVYELFAAFRAVLLADRTLDGVCDWARLESHTYRPIQDPTGVLAVIEFAIRVDATRFEGA